MASYGNISDEELRRRLLEHGQNFPVTASSREILIGKLKRLDSVENDRPLPGSARKSRSLLGFSSSDDSESDRGRPSGGSGGTPSASTAVSQSESASDAIHTPKSSVVRKTRRSRASDASGNSSLTTRRRSTGHHHQPISSTAADFRTPSSADRHSLAESTSHSRQSRTARSAAAAPDLLPRPSNLELSDSDVSDSSITNIPENRDVNEFPKSRRSMYADWRPTAVASSSSSSSSASFSTRTSNAGGLRWSTTPRALNGNHDSISGDHLSTPAPAAESDVTNQANSSQCISMVLLAVVFLFFLVVAVIYLGARHKDLVPYFAIGSEKGSSNTLCNPDSGENCVVSDVAKKIHESLQIMAGEAMCNGQLDNALSSRMPLQEAVRRAIAFAGYVPIHMSDVLNVFVKNPRWGVRLLKEDGTVAANSELHHVRWLESAIPDVPLLCRLKLAFVNTLFKSAVILAGTLALVILGYASYWFLEWKRKEREEVFALVEKILDILQNHARACQVDSKLTPYLAIPHVRDMLTPPADRRSNRRIWDNAVRFIQNNESRVRFETQCVEGEDFQVWRWLQPDTRSTGVGKSPRIWQGQAFETLDSGMNALPSSSTPCLKVRNMFNPDVEYEDDWPLHIQDSILEKCIDADILHLKVDPSSNEGCVFIKCKDSATAGKVFRDLHGWWFDGKLVTVKFLRLERYHQRFPEAANCFRYLRPNTVASQLSKMRGRPTTYVSTAAAAPF